MTRFLVHEIRSILIYVKLTVFWGISWYCTLLPSGLVPSGLRYGDIMFILFNTHTGKFDQWGVVTLKFNQQDSKHPPECFSLLYPKVNGHLICIISSLGARFERRGLLDFWRRMKFKMAATWHIQPVARWVRRYTQKYNLDKIEIACIKY